MYYPNCELLDTEEQLRMWRETPMPFVEDQLCVEYEPRVVKSGSCRFRECGDRLFGRLHNTD